MADIDDLLGSGDLDYEQDFGEQELGEAKDSEDEKMEEEEKEDDDDLGFGKDEVLYDYELDLPQQHIVQAKEMEDIDGKSVTKEEEIPETLPQNVSKDEIDYDDLQLSPLPPPDDNDDFDEPQNALSPLPPPDENDENEPPSTPVVQPDCDHDSTADQLMAAVLEGLDDQVEENNEQKNKHFEKNEVDSVEDEDDEDDDDNDDDDDDDIAEGKRRHRSRFKSERTKLSFNTLVEEKKDIVDSLETVQVPQSEKGNLINFTIPKVKPVGLIEPDSTETVEPAPKVDVVQTSVPEQIDEVSLHLLGYMQQPQPEKDDSSDNEKMSDDDDDSVKACEDDDDDDDENDEPRQRFKTERAVVSLTEGGTRKSISTSDPNVKRVIPDSLDMVKVDLATSSRTTMKPGSICEKFVVPSNRIGSVIGKGGENIKKICAMSGAHCDLDRNNESEKAFNIMGLPMQVYQAKVMIARQAQMNIEVPMPKIENNNGVQEKTVENSINVNISTGGVGIATDKFTIPFSKAGLVIGKGGENIRKIILQTGAIIHLDKTNSTEKIFTIKGQPMQRYNAKVLIAEAAQMKDVTIQKPETNQIPNLMSKDVQQSSFQNPGAGIGSKMGMNNYLVNPSTNYSPLQLPGGIPAYGSYTGVGYNNYNQGYNNYNQAYSNYNQGYTNFSQGYSNYNQFSMSVPSVPTTSSHTSSPQLSNMSYSPYQSVGAIGSNNRGTNFQTTLANSYALSTSYQTTQANSYGLNQTYSSQTAALPSVTSATASTSSSSDVRSIIEKARLQKVENFLKKIDDKNQSDVRSIIETSRLKKVGNILKTLDDQDDVGSYSHSYSRNHTRNRSRSRSRSRSPQRIYYY